MGKGKNPQERPSWVESGCRAYSLERLLIAVESIASATGPNFLVCCAPIQVVHTPVGTARKRPSAQEQASFECMSLSVTSRQCHLRG
jgi:hypothetical protein